MNRHFRMALLLLLLNVLGIGGFWFSTDKVLGTIVLVLSIAFSVLLILLLKTKDDNYAEISKDEGKRRFMDKLTPQNKIAIFFLSCVIFLIPSLYFKSQDFTFGSIFTIQIFLLLIFVKNTYFALLSFNFISTPINTIHHELENTGSLEQRKIELTVQYS